MRIFKHIVELEAAHWYLCKMHVHYLMNFIQNPFYCSWYELLTYFTNHMKKSMEEKHTLGLDFFRNEKKEIMWSDIIFLGLWTKLDERIFFFFLL